MRKYDFYPYNSGYTWTVLSGDVMYKRIDKTLVNEKWTGVPKEIVSFFAGYDLMYGDEKEISLIFNGEIFKTKIYCGKNGRSRLLFHELYQILKLNKLAVDFDSIWFERISGQYSCFYIYVEMKSNVIGITYDDNKISDTFGYCHSTYRIGQRLFKKRVNEICGSQCIVTGVKEQIPSILIASHIKPWKVSNAFERLDGNNGLLLSPHLDRLFDTGLFTFTEQSQILPSPVLSCEVIDNWGISLSQEYSLNHFQQDYMCYHRNMVFNQF